MSHTKKKSAGPHRLIRRLQRDGSHLVKTLGASGPTYHLEPHGTRVCTRHAVAATRQLIVRDTDLLDMPASWCATNGVKR
jgi:hypothetical protein